MKRSVSFSLWRGAMLVVGAGVLAVVLGMFFWALRADRAPEALPSALLSKAAPDFALPPVPGLLSPSFSTKDLTKLDKPVLVNFFASWCVPCRYEHPLLMRLAKTEKVYIMGINYKDNPVDVERWFRSDGNPYSRIGFDEKGRSAIDWGVSGVPETFLLDGSGLVRLRLEGPVSTPTARQKLRHTLTALGVEVEI